MPAIDGLSSGLDTASIIKQLMQLERIPQSRLQSKQNATESSLGSLRTLNAKFLSMSSAATALGATLPGAVPANPPKPSEWQLTSASSSDATRTSATAVAGAPAGSLTFHVKQLATAASSLSATYSGTTAPVAAPAADGTAQTQLTLTKGGVAKVIDTGDGSLAATVAAINKEKAGVTASMVQMVAATDSAPAQYRLQLTSTTTGANSTVSLKAADGIELVPTVAVAGQDAQIDLGGGTLISRSSNTISDVMEGVTLTLSKADTLSGGVFAGPPLTISVKKDVDGIASKVQALVDAANAARSDAKSLTAVDPISKAKGRLYGDSMVRGLVDEVRSTVPDGLSKVAQAGVTVDRNGVISFDKATFLKALEADPAAVEAALGKDGMAGRMLTLADAVSRGPAADGGPGRISTAITSRESQISSIKSNIESWDSRLAMKEKQLQRTYTSLETALGRSQSQGAWLSSQLANLPKWS